MKFWILFLFSIISIAYARFQSHSDLNARTRLDLKQQIVMLENNALRNILREQILSKRSEILEEAIGHIQNMRSRFPIQLKADEKSILMIVQNLKAMNVQNQAQNAR